MNLYNPTNDVIEDRFNNFTYVVGPQSNLSVSDDCAKHMLKRKGRYGLVSLDYSEAEEKKFGSLAAYKESKKNEGLKTYKAWKQECLNQEMLFPREVNHKNGGEVELSSTQVPKFKSKMEEIDALMRIKSSDDIFVKPSIEVAPLKKRGRPFRKSQVTHVEQASA